MKIRRIDHIGVVVDDFAAAKAFFVDFGLHVQGEFAFEGKWLDKIVGLKNVKTTFAFLKTPDGETAIELIKFHSPLDKKGIQKCFPNTLGIRHIAFAVENIDALVAKLKKKGIETFTDVQRYEDSYKLCYIRGPEGIILELAEEIRR